MQYKYIYLYILCIHYLYLSVFRLNYIYIEIYVLIWTSDIQPKTQSSIMTLMRAD
jgi:hypothetical protein